MGQMIKPKKINPYDTIKHGSDNPKFEFCIITYWLYDLGKVFNFSKSMSSSVELISYCCC